MCRLRQVEERTRQSEERIRQLKEQMERCQREHEDPTVVKELRDEKERTLVRLRQVEEETGHEEFFHWALEQFNITGDPGSHFRTCGYIKQRPW
jgi:vacuolar-type H+-ATPase subunit I/STV1